MLRPYGKIEAALTTKQIKEKLNPKNCEWFTRPKVAMSEMAETCSENIEGASQVLRRWLQDEITRMMVKCKEAVHPLNTKNDAPVTPEVVSKMRQFHCTNKANEVKFFEDMEKLANIILNRHTFQILNTKEYAQMIQMPGGGGDKDFKSNTNATGLQTLFTDQLVTAESDQLHDAMDHADDVLAELRGTPPDHVKRLVTLNPVLVVVQLHIRKTLIPRIVRLVNE